MMKRRSAINGASKRRVSNKLAKASERYGIAKTSIRKDGGVISNPPQAEN